MFTEDYNPRYDLVGIDGNAFSVMGYVMNSMCKERFTRQEIDEYRKKATSSDYHNLLCVSVEYVDKCNERYFEKNH